MGNSGTGKTEEEKVKRTIIGWSCICTIHEHLVNHIAGVYEEECSYVCQQTRETRKLEVASCEAAWPLAEVTLAENHTVTMVRQETEAKIMHRPEAEVGKERVDTDEGTQGRRGS